MMQVETKILRWWSARM